MILHEFPLSSASYRVRIALNLKGVAYETRTYRLRAGEHRSAQYLELNPAGLVPTLEANGLRLTQSLAIIDYLDATVQAPRLIPEDPVERARALAFALTIACDIHPLNNLRVLAYLERQLGQDERSRAIWYSTWVTAGFASLEATLRERPDEPFASGHSPGLADVFLVPQVFNARRFNVVLEAFPRIIATVNLANSIPAFARAAPGNG